MIEIQASRITMDADICHGKPCTRGLRYPVETILEWLGAGMTTEDILVVLAFASKIVRVKRIELSFWLMRNYPSIGWPARKMGQM